MFSKCTQIHKKYKYNFDNFFLIMKPVSNYYHNLRIRMCVLEYLSVCSAKGKQYTFLSRILTLMGNECQTKTSQPSHGSSQIRSQDDDFRFVYYFTLLKTVIGNEESLCLLLHIYYFTIKYFCRCNIFCIGLFQK